jgi:ABC-type spermidine/putrescine transport system permease subunit II
VMNVKAIKGNPQPFNLSLLVAKWGKIAPALVLLVLIAILPVARLLELSFLDGGKWSLDHYGRLLSSPVYLRVLGTTFQIAALTTIFTLILSYPITYFAAKLPRRQKNMVLFVIMLSFWSSFLIKTFGWMVILSKNGLLSQLLELLGFVSEPVGFLYTPTAVVIGMTHAMVPLCILTMLPVFQSIDHNLSKAAMVLGGKPGSVFWQIYFPLSFPGVTAAALLVFITSLGFFIVPAFLGGRLQTMLTQLIIEQIQEYLNWPFAGALSLLLLLSALLVFWIYDHLIGLSALAGTSDQDKSGRSMGSISRRLMKIASLVSDGLYNCVNRLVGSQMQNVGNLTRHLVIGLTLLFLIFPVLVMVPVSFTEGSRMTWPPEGFSLRWYEAILTSQIWTQAAIRSLIVALASATLAVIIGTPAAFAIARQKLPAKTLILAIILSPLIMPRMVLAVALFYLYAQIGLVGTYVGLIIGHAILAIPYVVITIIAVQKQFDPRYEQAAWSLGARKTQTLQRVTLPLLSGGLFSAFIFAMITSFDELTIALFVTGGLTTTLPKQMWDDAMNIATPTLAALSTLMLLFVAGLTLIGLRLQSRN